MLYKHLGFYKVSTRAKEIRWRYVYFAHRRRTLWLSVAFIAGFVLLLIVLCMVAVG